MTVVAPGIRYIDVAFQQRPSVIATAVLDSPAGVALIDPGPASCLPTLLDSLTKGGIAPRDVQAILLTHIHLDHAGATGSLVREHPHIRVYVHERGAPHMIDPSRLLASATRIYGADMDRLWGEMVPVPAANVTTLAGGEQIDPVGRRLEVAYTPGHASHHVSYFDPQSRIAFVGDVGGIRLGPAVSFVLPPTPPPDIDVEAWGASVDRIRAWHPATLFLTHFGPVEHPIPHLQQVLDRLQQNAALAKSILEREGTDEERAAAFTRELHRELRRALPEDEAVRYELAVAAEHCWQGLARYWQRRGTVASPRAR